MTRVLALCSAVDVTGAVKQFDLARPHLGGRFEVVRHAVPSDTHRLLAAVNPDLVHTLGADAFRAVRRVALATVRPGVRTFPAWLATGASAVEPTFGFTPGLTATLAMSERDRDWAARLTPAPMQFSAAPAVAFPIPDGATQKDGSSQRAMILAAGGFDATANLKHIVWAFDVLKYAHPGLLLVLLGDGPQRPEVERFARSLGSDDLRVECVGFQHDLTPYFRHAVQAWVSHTHGGTKFLLEAMASRVPVIATRTTDTEPVLRNGECGRLVPTDRPVEMARAAHGLLTSPHQASALVVAGEAAAARYSVADLADAITGVYHTLTSSDSPRFE